MEKINEVLAQRVKTLMFNDDVSQADIARSVGEKPQTFGNYVRGRTIPAKLLRQWKIVYKEDLEKLSETNVPTIVASVNEPKHKDPVKVLPMDAWELLQDDNREFKKEIGNLWDMIRYLKGQGVKAHE